jgi:5-methylcytosine-specific restriction endonuclease McrA
MGECPAMKFPKARPRLLSKREEAKLRAMLWRLVRAEVFIRDQYKCRVCRKRKAYDAHHLLAKSLGGRDEAATMVAVCRLCHQGIHGNVVKMRWRDEQDRAGTVTIERVA